MPTPPSRARTAIEAIAGAAAVLAAAVVAGRLEVGPAGIAGSLAAAVLVGLLVAMRPAVGVATMLLAVILTDTVEVRFAVDLHLVDELSTLATGAVALVAGRERLRAARPGWREAALALAVAAGIVSSLLHAVPPATWIPALGLFVKGAVFLYAVSWLRPDIRSVEGAGAALVTVALVVLGLGLVEMWNPAAFQDALGLPRYEEIRGGIAAVKSVFLSPAIFGWFTVFASLLLYARFMVFREWWALIAALLLNVGTLLSARRRPLVGLAAALAAGVVATTSRGVPPRDALKQLAPLAGGVVVVGLIATLALSSFWAGTVEEYIGPGDLSEILRPNPDADLVAPAHPRMVLYVAAVAIARDEFPFGVGLGRFGSYMSEVDYSPVYVRYGLTNVYGLRPGQTVAVSDTYWPMVLGELGPVGLVGMIAFFVLLLADLWRVAARASPALRAIGLAALLVLVESLVDSLAAPLFVAPPIAFFVFGIAGVALSLRSTAPLGEPRSQVAGLD